MGSGHVAGAPAVAVGAPTEALGVANPEREARFVRVPPHRLGLAGAPRGAPEGRSIVAVGNGGVLGMGGSVERPGSVPAALAVPLGAPPDAVGVRLAEPLVEGQRVGEREPLDERE